MEMRLSQKWGFAGYTWLCGERIASHIPIAKRLTQDLLPKKNLGLF